MSDASTPTTGGSTKTKRPDIYPTLGQECGCCGHRQPTVRDTRRCLADYRRREFSDRRPCRCHRRRSRVPGRSSSPLTLGSGVPFALTTAPFGDGVAPGASKGRDSCRRASNSGCLAGATQAGPARRGSPSRARPPGSVPRRGQCVGGRDSRWPRLADAPPWRRSVRRDPRPPQCPSGATRGGVGGVVRRCGGCGRGDGIARRGPTVGLAVRGSRSPGRGAAVCPAPSRPLALTARAYAVPRRTRRRGSAVRWAAVPAGCARLWGACACCSRYSTSWSPASSSSCSLMML